MVQAFDLVEHVDLLANSLAAFASPQIWRAGDWSEMPQSDIGLSLIVEH
jgi:hypothetical protein